MGNIIGTELNLLDSKGKNFFMFTGNLNRKVLVITDTNPSKDHMEKVVKKVGTIPTPKGPFANLLVRGRCFKDETDPVNPVTVFVPKNPTFNDGIRTACSPFAVVFRKPAPDPVPTTTPTGQTPLTPTQGGTGPLPQTPTNQPPLTSPRPGNVPLPQTPTNQNPLRQARAGNGPMQTPTNQPPLNQAQPGNGPLPTTPTNQPPLNQARPGNVPLPQVPTNQNPLRRARGGNLPVQTPTGQPTANVPTNNPVPTGNPVPTNNPVPVVPSPHYNTNDHYVPPMPPIPTLAWLRSVGTPRPPAPVDMKKRFDKQRMDPLKEETTRGFWAGQGDFELVFVGVGKLQEHQDTIAAYQQKNPGPLDQKVAAKLMAKYDDLIKKVSKYRDNFGEDGSAVKSGFFSRKKGRNDTRDKKIEFTDDVLQAALAARAELQMGPRFQAMGVLSQKAANGTFTDDEQQQYSELRAEYLLNSSPDGAEKATGGSSDVRIVRDADGNVAYAFKSIDGESSQMNMAKGEGTAHEVLTSKLSDIFGTFGFNTGFPKTSLATLPLPDGSGKTSNKVGALVEGLSGKVPAEKGELNPFAEILKMGGVNVDIADIKQQLRNLGVKEDDLDSKVGNELYQAAKEITPDQKKAIAQKMNGRLALMGKKWDENTRVGDMQEDMLELENVEGDALANQVPPVEMQQALLAGMLSSSADIKWSNIMIDGATARPFDGGGNMLTAQQMKQTQTTKSGKVDPLIGTSLLALPSGRGMHPGATQPIDPTLKGQVLQIDPNVVEQEMTTAVQKVKQTTPELQNALGDSNVQMSVASLICMQDAIRAAAPNATMEEIVDAFNLNLKAWMEGTDYPNAPAH